ncbi:MAG: zinc ribbon domain-containing protein [Candidatus Hodarchaeota archaeon]
MIRKRKFCEICKKEILTDSDYCPICKTELKKARKYCKFCERDIIVDSNTCPLCGKEMYEFKKIKIRVKCLDCLEEFCITEIKKCPSCQSKQLEELECPCVFYPIDCVDIIKN